MRLVFNIAVFCCYCRFHLTRWERGVVECLTLRSIAMLENPFKYHRRSWMWRHLLCWSIQSQVAPMCFNGITFCSECLELHKRAPRTPNYSEVHYFCHCIPHAPGRMYREELVRSIAYIEIRCEHSIIFDTVFFVARKVFYLHFSKLPFFLFYQSQAASTSNVLRNTRIN